MMLTTPNEDLRAQVLSAIEIVDEHHRSSSGWSERYGHAFAFLFQMLEKDLKEWIRANPPGHADYDKSTPERAVYLYADEVHPDFKTAHDILYNNLPHFKEVVVKAFRSRESSSRKSERDIVAGRHPEYLSLLKQIREMKKRWNAEDAAIKKTESFRMMGGLARMGSHAGSEYARLVKQAQAMEQATLGKILTKHHRAS
jgi:hypothetical protein